MAYKVIKGWPSEGAIDMSISLAVAGAVVAGDCGVINSSGVGVIGAYNVTGADAGTLEPFFCIDVDSVTGKVLGLMSPCMIEVDTDHFVAGSYAPGKAVSMAGGKFSLIAATEDLRRVVGTVFAYDSSVGTLTIYWNPEVSPYATAAATAAATAVAAAIAAIE